MNAGPLSPSRPRALRRKCRQHEQTATTRIHPPLTQLFGLLHDVITKPVRGLEWLFGRWCLGRGRRGEERKHGGPVAHHAHLPALVRDAASEVVGAPLFVTCVSDALYLDRLRKGVPCGIRRFAAGGLSRALKVAGTTALTRGALVCSVRKETVIAAVVPHFHKTKAPTTCVSALIQARTQISHRNMYPRLRYVQSCASGNRVESHLRNPAINTSRSGTPPESWQPRRATCSTLRRASNGTVESSTVGKVKVYRRKTTGGTVSVRATSTTKLGVYQLCRGMGSAEMLQTRSCRSWPGNAGHLPSEVPIVRCHGTTVGGR